MGVKNISCCAADLPGSSAVPGDDGTRIAAQPEVRTGALIHYFGEGPNPGS